MKADVVPVRLGKHWLLVRAGMISEFLANTPWLSVPGSTPILPGVMIWRGRAIPVLDLPRALNLESLGPLSEHSRIMVVEHATGAVAVPIDGAREVRALDECDIHPPHVSTIPYAAGEVDITNEVFPLVEVDQLLQELGRTNT